MKSKRTNQQSLVKKKKLPGGKIEAVHSWPTGYQVLVFEDQAHFDRALDGIRQHNESQPIKIEA